HRAVVAPGDEERAVRAESAEGKRADEERVPVEHSRLATRLEVSEPGREEAAARVERRTAQHVAERHAQYQGHERARAAQPGVPEDAPERTLEMGTQLDGDSSQAEEPEHQH